MSINTIYLIHHSHLDVGYTELPQKIRQRQINYVYQTLAIIEQHPTFKWVADTFWPLEQFLAQASEGDKARLSKAIQNGQLDVSTNYLNFTENLGYVALKAVHQRAVDYGCSIGMAFDCAMTADINGHSLAFAKVLTEAGTQNLFSCVHTHHGMFPLFKNQTPFYWQMPNGQKLLVWNGEHYFLGNALGLIPQGSYFNYLVNDDFERLEDEMAIAERRVLPYLEHLEAEGYPYEFVPMMGSGLITDNAPPNVHILRSIEAWNQKYGHRVKVVLATLPDFFQKLRQQTISIPTYEGAWPDWWSDGFLADPSGVRIFKTAQRQFHLMEKLKVHYPTLQNIETQDVINQLALYAEHTFGHMNSLRRPYDKIVHASAINKQHYAVAAMETMEHLTEQALERLGALSFSTERSLRYRLLNPHDHDYAGLGMITLESIDLDIFGLREGGKVVRSDTQTELPHQVFEVEHGQGWFIPVTLAPGKFLEVEIIPEAKKVQHAFLSNSGTKGVDQVEDVLGTKHPLWVSENALETPWVRLEWSSQEGIHTWFDRKQKIDLLRSDRHHPALSPVYERSVNTGNREERQKMGRNRKRMHVQRSIGQLMKLQNYEVGELFAKVVLEYQLSGTKSCTLQLLVYRDYPRIDSTLMVHKDSCLDAENLYFSLPFSLPQSHQLWFDTSVEPIRPWKDQIPGSLTDFYTVQEGFAICAENYGIAVATRDSSVMQLGALAHKPRILAGMPELETQEGQLYAWLMTNYWETNFPANMAGFHQFTHSILWGEHLSSPTLALRQCQDTNEGIYCYRV